MKTLKHPMESTCFWWMRNSEVLRLHSLAAFMPSPKTGESRFVDLQSFLEGWCLVFLSFKPKVWKYSLKQLSSSLRKDHPKPSLPGLRHDEGPVPQLRCWEDKKGAGWVATAQGRGHRWFFGSWFFWSTFWVNTCKIGGKKTIRCWDGILQTS